MEDLKRQGKVLLVGPFKDDSGALFVYEAASLDEAEGIFRSDPYFLHNVFHTYDIIEWDLKFAHSDIVKMD